MFVDRMKWIRWTEKNILFEVLIIGVFFAALGPIISLGRLTDFMIFCIFALSFDLLYGYMGRLSFGHMLYLGIGAYTTGLIIKYLTNNALIGLLCGIGVTVIVASFLGLIVVRTTGACFALINLALNHTGFFLVLSPLRKLTRGEDGFGINPASFGFMDFSSRTFIFIFVLCSLLVVYFLLRKLTSSPYGIVIRAIKENELRLRFVGYNTFFFKWLTFCIAAAVAGFAGGLTALNYKYINPNVMDVNSNVGPVFACLIGGAGNLYGALIGGMVYMVISNFLPIYTHRWEMFLGICLLLITFRFRKGIWGYVVTKIYDSMKKGRELAL